MSINISATATPSRSRNAEVVKTVKKEEQLSKDMRSYKNLRRQGLQPKHIDGSARMESQAEHRMEVETGALLPTKVASSTVEDVSKIVSMQKEASRKAHNRGIK